MLPIPVLSGMKSQCNGFHPEGDELKEARLRWRQEQSRRLASNVQADDPHGDKEKKSHAYRAAVFADWLCEAYLDSDFSKFQKCDLRGI